MEEEEEEGEEGVDAPSKSACEEEEEVEVVAADGAFCITGVDIAITTLHIRATKHAMEALLKISTLLLAVALKEAEEDGVEVVVVVVPPP